MRAFTKGAEPTELREHRSRSDDPNRYSIDAFPDKERLRARLLEDQQYLCCYCMGRIDDARMKIEHLRPQSAGDERDRVAWDNLLAACPGNQGRPPSEQHCDTRKGDRALRLHPFSPAVGKLRYLSDGKIRIDDPDLQRDLDDVLNLNQRDLVANRNHALAALVHELTARSGSTWSPATLQRKLEALRAAPRAQPYLGMLEWWLAEHIRRRSAP